MREVKVIKALMTSFPYVAVFRPPEKKSLCDSPTNSDSFACWFLLFIHKLSYLGCLIKAFLLLFLIRGRCTVSKSYFWMAVVSCADHFGVFFRENLLPRDMLYESLFLLPARKLVLTSSRGTPVSCQEIAQKPFKGILCQLEWIP